MKYIVSTACVLSALVGFCIAAPAPQGLFSGSANLQVGAGGASGSASGTASAGGGAAGGGGLTNILSQVDIPGLLRGVNSFVKLVGVFCPPLSQVLDNVIQNVTSTAFRVFGRLILQSGGLGGGGGGGGGGQSVNVVLPTFPPDEDDYDEDEDSDSTSTASTDNVDLRVASSTTSTTTDTSETVSPANEENAISKRHARVVREVESEDQEEAESAPQPAEEDADSDDADRNKRYLPFGGSVSGHAGGGGSGNFLFDIIRLVAGSGATEAGDEHANAPGGVAEVDISKGVGGHADGYTEGIPGPITRLFVIANRGLANLVQDLILRLAQTSEKIVNFKARLVTSLI